MKPTIYPNMKGTLYVFPGVGGTLGDLHAKRLGSTGTLEESGRPKADRWEEKTARAKPELDEQKKQVPI